MPVTRPAIRPFAAAILIVAILASPSVLIAGAVQVAALMDTAPGVAVPTAMWTAGR
jgi:hypothetical protein